MTTDEALPKLLTWFSSGFPIGAYAYSHGIEQAIRDGVVHDGRTLSDWLHDLIEHGSLWNDAVLLAAAYRADAAELHDLSELCIALAASRERRHESCAQGDAFLRACAPHWPGPPPDATAPLPIAIGQAAVAHGLPLMATLIGHLHGAVASLVGVAIRAVPIGQTAGLAVLARSEPCVLATAARAARSDPGDLGSATILSDIAAMRHETLDGRLFIS